MAGTSLPINSHLINAVTKKIMDETRTKSVIISSEAFLRLKQLQSEFGELIETIEILKSPDLMEKIQRPREDVLAGRIHSKCRWWSGE